MTLNLPVAEMRHQNWRDKLEDHGRKAIKEKRKHEPRPHVQDVIVSVRNASENDRGGGLTFWASNWP